MTKKAYMKPAMNVVKIQQRASILSTSKDVYGMNKNLQTDETTTAWSRGGGRHSDVWDDDEEEQ